MSILSIALISCAVNLPLGYLRSGAQKFSIAWFTFIHLSIPLILYLRIKNKVHAVTIPIFIASAVIGQLCGGKLRKKEHS
ncbi:MAG: hypothetical protein GTN70_07600 [Deltaproteobacteria bacterium]|nr:hypothetical protein [Deltaproteobacteria bacterium]NIS77560.1 hypothetical protein [Deltaproteobacteria bacterium]